VSSQLLSALAALAALPFHNRSGRRTGTQTRLEFSHSHIKLALYQDSTTMMTHFDETQDIDTDCPYSQFMYICGDSEAQEVLLRKATSVHHAGSRHSDCPEEVEVLQLLCQFLHARATPAHAKMIELVFNKTKRLCMLQPAQPST
jgi:hypothetical protein